MNEKGNISAECAVSFEHLQGEIERLKNGKKDAANVMREFAISLKTMADLQAAHHGETIRVLTGFNGNTVELIAKLSERVASVEASSRSMHKRLDEDKEEKRDIKSMIAETRRMIWAVVLLGLASTATALFSIFGGG